LDTWVDKYKPKSIDDLALDPEHKKVLNEYLGKGSCPNMLLAGHAGIGKTTIAKLIPTFIEDSTSLYINASDENGIDTVRNKIKDFVEAEGFGGLKILILDEADGLSDQAQKALRNTLETSLEDTRFILTCNFPGKIIEPIKSRCPEINLSCKPQDVLKRACEIIKDEGIKVSKDDIIKMKGIVDRCFPDIRKTIGYLERCFVTGKFVQVSVKESTGADKIVEMILENSNSFSAIHKCREYWIKNEPEFGTDYSLLGSSLYNAIEDSSKGDDAGLLIRLSTHLYQLDNSIDKEVQFHAMTLELLS
jgi:replication factor C small subunit